MTLLVFNGLLVFMLFMCNSAEIEPGNEPAGELRDMGFKNARFVDIQARNKACRNIEGKCIKTNKGCPNNKPLETKPGKPYCNKRRRCCYPELGGTKCDSPDFIIKAGTRYGCPCSYYGAERIDSWMGGQCCQPSDCPNPKFTALHVCGRDGGQTCRNATDALEFARQAWTDPSAIEFPIVFPCSSLSYVKNGDTCVMDLSAIRNWSCSIKDGVVTSCWEVPAKCSVNHNVNTGAIIGSVKCVEN